MLGSSYFLCVVFLLEMTLKQEGLLASHSRRPAKELRVLSSTENQQESQEHVPYQSEGELFQTCCICSTSYICPCSEDVRVILDRLQSLSYELRRIDKEERDQLPT